MVEVRVERGPVVTELERDSTGSAVARRSVTLELIGQTFSWRMATAGMTLDGRELVSNTGAIWLERRAVCCGRWNGVAHGATAADPSHV